MAAHLPPPSTRLADGLHLAWDSLSLGTVTGKRHFCSDFSVYWPFIIKQLIYIIEDVENTGHYKEIGQQILI